MGEDQIHSVQHYIHCHLPLCEEEKVEAPMIPWRQNVNGHFPIQASSALCPTWEGCPAASTSAFQQHIVLFCGQNKVRRAGLCGLKWPLHPCHAGISQLQPQDSVGDNMHLLQPWIKIIHNKLRSLRFLDWWCSLKNGGYLWQERAKSYWQKGINFTMLHFMRQQRVSWFCALKVNRTIFQSSLFSCPNAHNRFLQIGIYVCLSASNKVEQLSLPFISVLLPLFQYPCVHCMVPAFRFY